MAGPASDKPVDTYSPFFGFVYIFNLIIGVGALSLPKAFSQAGVILGTLLLFMLAFMSYMTATFMIEAMAIANALFKFRERSGQSKRSSKLSSISHKSPDIQKVDESGAVAGSYGAVVTSPSHSSSQTESESEKTPLVPTVIDSETVFTDSDDSEPIGHVIPPDDYEISQKFEMGTLANQFYHPVGVFLYYVVICLYLYGDLAIYAVAIPKSITKVACGNGIVIVNMTNLTNVSSEEMEWNLSNSTMETYCFGNVSNQQAYYIFLSISLLLLCPWTFFNLTKSKYLQLFTTILRNVAFAMMVGIAVSNLALGNTTTPSNASLSGFPLLFGVSIYSFMCQHSLPGMITPMRRKNGIFWKIGVDFALILSFYLLLTFTGAFWLPESKIKDIYTLNFFKRIMPDDNSAEKLLSVLGYYLALFPVFTLSTNFPIISITLRENLKALFRVLLHRWIGDNPYPWPVEHLLFPILALFVPIGIAFGTQNVELLVSVTGSFPGVGVQYVIPVTLAFCGKYIITSSKRYNMKYENKYRSPFSYIFFLVFVLLWTTVSMVLLIVDDALKIAEGKFI